MKLILYGHVKFEDESVPLKFSPHTMSVQYCGDCLVLQGTVNDLMSARGAL